MIRNESRPCRRRLGAGHAPGLGVDHDGFADAVFRDRSQGRVASDEQVERLAPVDVRPFGAVDNRAALDRHSAPAVSDPVVCDDPSRLKRKLDGDGVTLRPLAIDRDVAQLIGN